MFSAAGMVQSVGPPGCRDGEEVHMMTDRRDPRRTRPLRMRTVLAGCRRKRSLFRRYGAVVLALVASRTPPTRAAETVNVLYAGSLVNLMEHGIGPAFEKSTGETFHGFAGGSNGLANQIKGKLRQGDVFISASPRVDSNLMGPANGSWVSWYVSFAESPLMIGYNAASRFAADFRTKP